MNNELIELEGLERAIKSVMECEQLLCQTYSVDYVTDHGNMTHTSFESMLSRYNEIFDQSHEGASKTRLSLNAQINKFFLDKDLSYFTSRVEIKLIPNISVLSHEDNWAAEVDALNMNPLILQSTEVKVKENESTEVKKTLH